MPPSNGLKTPRAGDRPTVLDGSSRRSGAPAEWLWPYSIPLRPKDAIHPYRAMPMSLARLRSCSAPRRQIIAGRRKSPANVSFRSAAVDNRAACALPYAAHESFSLRTLTRSRALTARGVPPRREDGGTRAYKVVAYKRTTDDVRVKVSPRRRMSMSLKVTAFSWRAGTVGTRARRRWDFRVTAKNKTKRRISQPGPVIRWPTGSSSNPGYAA
jgi:hypothetical protein